MKLLDEIDSPFPLGGCLAFGDMIEELRRAAFDPFSVNDLELPDCCVGFYDSLVVFDHRLGKAR